MNPGEHYRPQTNQSRWPCSDQW